VYTTTPCSLTKHRTDRRTTLFQKTTTHPPRLGQAFGPNRCPVSPLGAPPQTPSPQPRKDTHGPHHPHRHPRPLRPRPLQPRPRAAGRERAVGAPQQRPRRPAADRAAAVGTRGRRDDRARDRRRAGCLRDTARIRRGERAWRRDARAAPSGGPLCARAVDRRGRRPAACSASASNAWVCTRAATSSRMVHTRAKR
jgi:hypothetical protein